MSEKGRGKGGKNEKSEKNDGYKYRTAATKTNESV
jgi:hypothetical protein